MVKAGYTLFEQMLVTGAQFLSNDTVAFVGFHWPMVMARIARRLQAPSVTIVYESGIVEDRLTSVFPTSPCDLTAAEGAIATLGSADALYSWLGSGRVDLTMLEAAVVDRFGNINTTAIGPYEHPKVRLPGSGGGTELSALGRGLLLVSASTNPRSYPDRVDYITSPGYFGGRSERTALGYPEETGPQHLINPLGIFGFDENGEMYPTKLHAGVTPEDVSASFSWPIRIGKNIEILPTPTKDQLVIVREELEYARQRLYTLPED